MTFTVKLISRNLWTCWFRNISSTFKFFPTLTFLCGRWISFQIVAATKTWLIVWLSSSTNFRMVQSSPWLLSRTPTSVINPSPCSRHCCFHSQVLQQNTCSMAKIIRSFYAGDVTLPSLSVNDRLSLQFLVGMGVEKMKLDCMTPFIRKTIL